MADGRGGHPLQLWRALVLTLAASLLAACPSLPGEERSGAATTVAPGATVPDPTPGPTPASSLPEPPLTERQRELLARVVPSPACPDAGPRRPVTDRARQVEVEIARVVDTCLVHSYERVSRADLDRRLDELLRQPDVVAASPIDYEVYPQAETTPREQWALRVLGAPAVARWDWPTGSGVRVAVLDGGIADHDDLEERVVARWNADGTDEPHGTHVAGIIGAAAGNGIGTVGFAPRVELLDVPVIGGGTVADGVRWAVDNGADVLNMSFAIEPALTEAEMERAFGDDPDPTGPFATTVAALALAQQRGVVLVAAVGNCGDPTFLPPGCDGVHNARVLPAVYPAAIAVASTDEHDGRAGTSSQVAHVDMAAPGVAIESLAPGRETVREGGTSMAAPHVAAAAAILLSDGGPLAGIRDRVERAARVSNLLRSTARDLAPPGRDDSSGEGRLDINAALAAAAAHRDDGAAGRRLTTVLVLDVSPSMEERVPGGSGRKLDAAVEAARDIVDLARVDQSDGDEHRVGVVVFGGDAELLVEPTERLDGVDRVLGSISVIGSTNVGAGLELGGRQFGRDGSVRSMCCCPTGPPTGA